MNSLIRKSAKAYVDKVRLVVQGGTGGPGLPHYGGIGGKGGDVYIKGTRRDITLKHVLKQMQPGLIKASDGQPSRRTRLLGESGRDLVIDVPLGVTIEDEHKQLLGEINCPDDKIIVAQGGRGGDKFNDSHGFAGQKALLRLDYKLISDVVFVGYPNAGKSSLLRAISEAKPKVASYPFTTLRPYLGTVQFKDYRRITMADLPGLVEGAHKNVGLGHEFLKHMVRAKLLVFVIDVNDVDLGHGYPKRTPLETVSILNKEMELYDDTLLWKPSILALSKMDTVDDVEAKCREFSDLYNRFIEEEENLMEPSLLPRSRIRFAEVLPISSVSGLNIDKLKEVARDLLDKQAELEREKSGQAKEYGDLILAENNRIMPQ